MKKNIRILVLSFVSLSLNACSLAPGVPGLKKNSSSQYKLVIINAETINNQSPFDYSAYVRDKKTKRALYQKPKPENRPQNISSKRSSSIQDNGSYLTREAQIKSPANEDSNASIITSKVRYEGVSSEDNKANYQYKLGKGDVLSITVWDHPELTSPSQNNSYGGHVIGNDGRFYFPYSGKINAASKTIRNIRDELESKLGSFITKPQVSVSISEFRSQKVYTTGAVAKPTTLMVDDTPMTVRDAISESNGLRANQYTGYATLARKGKNILIDLNRMLKHNDNRQNFILKAGDRLHIVERTELAEFNRKLNLDIRRENTLSSARLRNQIRNIKALNPIQLEVALDKERAVARLKSDLERELRSEQAKVFVMGEVQKPGSVRYQIEDGMTLAEAINDAGSFNEGTVDPKGIFVIRKDSRGDKIPTVYQLPIASVEAIFFAEQFNIRPRDIVYITAMPSIKWNRILSQLLPSLTVYNALN